MREKLFGRGRRGGVLLIAGAVLGAAVAGPGATIAQKAMAPFNQKTADKRYVKRAEVAPVAGQTVETPLTKFTTATFSPIATANIKVPGPGTVVVHGSLSAKADGAAGDDRLQYRLSVGGTPLTTTPQAFELFLDEATDGRQNGSVDGIAKVTQKGSITVNLEAQNVAPSTGVDILGRDVTAQFVPKAKVGKKKKKPSGGGNTSP